VVNFDEILPTVPPDLRPILSDLYDQATSVTRDIGHRIADEAREIAKMKGDPAALERGIEMIRIDVRSEITQARTELSMGLDGFNRSGAWEGSGANAFFDYVPRLQTAMTTLEQNCETTADAIAAIRAGIMDIWGSLIKETSATLAKTIGAISIKDDTIRADTVLGIIVDWVGFAGRLAAEFIKLDEQTYKALDKIGQAAHAPEGLDSVAGSSFKEYTGPSGFMLPMPTGVSLTPDWSAADVRAHWKLRGGASVSIQMEPYRKLVHTIRDNGRFWNAAAQKHIQAWQAMPAPAFSVFGGRFYQRLCDVMSRDYVTYFYSDERLNQLANLLDEVGAAYHQTDDESSTLIRDYLATD